MKGEKFKVGDRVQFHGLGPVGVITADKGIMTPASSSAPLAAAWPPEQVWQVEFKFSGITNSCGHWESDLDLVK